MLRADARERGSIEYSVPRGTSRSCITPNLPPCRAEDERLPAYGVLPCRRRNLLYSF